MYLNSKEVNQSKKWEWSDVFLRYELDNLKIFFYAKTTASLILIVLVHFFIYNFESLFEFLFKIVIINVVLDI